MGNFLRCTVREEAPNIQPRPLLFNHTNHRLTINIGVHRYRNIPTVISQKNKDQGNQWELDLTWRWTGCQLPAVASIGSCFGLRFFFRIKRHKQPNGLQSVCFVLLPPTSLICHGIISGDVWRALKLLQLPTVSCCVYPTNQLGHIISLISLCWHMLQSN